MFILDFEVVDDSFHGPYSSVISVAQLISLNINIPQLMWFAIRRTTLKDWKIKMYKYWRADRVGSWGN